MKILNRYNFYLMLLLIAVNCIAMFAAPALVLLGYSKFCFLLILPSLFLTNTLWVLIHEGIHSNLNSNLKTSNLYSRVLAIILHSNFDVLKFGHLMHHRYNRTEHDLTEGVDDLTSYNANTVNRVKGATSSLSSFSLPLQDSASPIAKKSLRYSWYKMCRTCTYYFHITMGIYLAELVSPLVLLLPVSWVSEVAEKIMGKDHPYLVNAKKILITPQKIRNIRLDNLINIVVLLSLILLYQKYIWVYAVYLLLRAFLISSVDNLPHYGTSLDRVNGSFNLNAPKLWQLMILNFNLHRVHHKYPYMPWHVLPKTFISDSEIYHRDYFKQYASQWRGVIEKKELIENDREDVTNGCAEIQTI